MTQKTYKSAQGKIVDMGALMLQNENIRAVGNMNVNARGDLLDSANRVIQPKNQQVQKQYARQTNVTSAPVTSGTREARVSKQSQSIAEPEIISAPEPVAEETVTPKGGLAAALARSREIKQQELKTPRQVAQADTLKKI